MRAKPVARVRTITVDHTGHIYYRRKGLDLRIHYTEPGRSGSGFVVEAGRYRISTQRPRHISLMSWPAILVWRRGTTRLFVRGPRIATTACGKEWRKFWGGADPQIIYLQKLEG